MQKKITRVSCYMWVLVLLVSAAGCTAPRSIINSGKVTPQGQFRAGFNVGGNIASSPLGEVGGISKSAVDALRNRDSIDYDSQIDVFSQGLMAYALDPVGPTFDFYLRYGIAERIDAGYKFASGAHVFDAMYQFMGSTGTVDNPGAGGDWYGSVGLQYAGQSANLLPRFAMNRLQSIFQFTATRHDLMVPLIFSKSFGVEEEYGHIAFGAVYNHSFVNYGFEPGRIYRRVAGERIPLESFRERNNFSSYGLFVNAKFGFKYIFILPAITMYYQNYGTYQLPGGREQSFSGMTFIPSIGVQAQFGRGRTNR